MSNGRSKERIETLNDIIVGIARRSQYKFKGITVDDISQELWIKVLKAEDKHEKSLDLDLVAHICYQGIKDLQRSEMRSNLYLIDNIETQKVPSSPSDVLEEFFLVEDLLELCPEGTPEGTCLRWFLTSTNIKDYGYQPQGQYKEGFTENELAKVLGLSSTSHRKYRRVRRRLRDLVSDYLGRSD